jgi:enterochelin esterase-like enzyme
VVAFLGDLLVITPQVVGCLLLAALLSLLGTVRLVRRHHLRLALPAGLLALVLTPAAAADVVNAHFQYLPRVADVVNSPTWPTAQPSVLLRRPTASHPQPLGAVVQLAIPGPLSGFGVHTAYVYLPPQYFTAPLQHFPVVYLLHGSPGAPVDWFRAARAAEAGLAVARAGEPVILVAPRASRSWTDDSECVNRPSEHVETYLAYDVPAGVDRMLRTIPTRAARAVVGNSAGGFCALNIGLRHREVFSGIADLSGYDHPTFTGGLSRLFGRSPRLAATVAAESPRSYVPLLRPEPRMHIWLDTGRSDGLPRRELRRLASSLAAVGQSVQYVERPGGHEYGVWRPALAQSLRWLAVRLSAAGSAT